MADLINEFIDAIKPKESTQKPHVYNATVSRVEDGVVYVQLTGAETDTPTALTASEVKRGDAVTVEWRNNRLYIAGNTTDPAAGVRRVQIVEQSATEAKREAAKASEIANEAQNVAGKTNQYFWHTETGTDTGAHITEIPREEFEADPQNGGGNLLARSNGIALRLGLTELLRILQDGILIGQDGGMQFKQTAAGMQFISADTNNRVLITSDSTHPFDMYDLITKTHIRTGSGIELVNEIDSGLHVNGENVTVDGDITDGSGNVLSAKADASGMFISRTATASGTIGANTNGRITGNLTTVSGYSPIAIMGVTSNAGASATITEFGLYNNLTQVSSVVRNVSSSQISVTHTYSVLYAKTSLIG